MRLFLDSVDFEEIDNAFDMGIFEGLTTTPTFMHRHGIVDVDKAIIRLSKKVPELQVEALGENYDEIMKEANRILKLPLKNKPVLKIPVSNHGIKACRTLTNKGIKVNMHLIYTLSQAYMSLSAGAAYVCPLVGRLHDQGHDAIGLIEQCVDIVNYYGYESQVMFSSVRHPEHVRQALLAGTHVCTVPWNVVEQLTKNTLTTIGSEQFFQHTKLITLTAGDVIRDRNPVCKTTETVSDALVEMTESALGAVSVVDAKGNLKGIFTDGDLRRYIEKNGKNILSKKMNEFKYKKPITINLSTKLIDTVDLFKKYQFDSLIVVKSNKPVGLLDIQDLVKKGLSV